MLVGLCLFSKMCKTKRPHNFFDTAIRSSFYGTESDFSDFNDARRVRYKPSNIRRVDRCAIRQMKIQNDLETRLNEPLPSVPALCKREKITIRVCVYNKSCFFLPLCFFSYRLPSLVAGRSRHKSHSTSSTAPALKREFLPPTRSTAIAK